MRASLLLLAAPALLVCADAFAQFVPAQPGTPPPPSPSTSAAPSSSVPPAASSAPPAPLAPPASAAPVAPAAPAPSAAPTETTPEAASPPPGMGNEVFVTHRAAEAPSSDWDVKGFLGWEFEARGGFVIPDSASPVTAPNLIPGMAGPGNPTGDILNGVENPYSYDPFGFSLTAGYRFLPFLSAGVFFDYANFQTNDETDTGGYVDSTSQLQRQVWQLGVYGRYYLTTLSRRLHPWAELDIGATEDTASYTRILGSSAATTNYYLGYWGVATNLKVGLDWRLHPYFSVGPYASYSRVFGVSGSVQVCPQSSGESGNCDTNSMNYRDTTSSAPVTTNGYGMVSVGIYLKVTVGPSLR